uniref:NADH dehydrogenase subunit 6 n=1 Tax=Agrilus zanthoxylumi TaxID=2696312 RepID=UPI00286A89ED|nr:NADH dehydrogenase subunit 6 [Agrilus zanthoxylumi]WKF51815.1 NADH dehydrogenase subunit 6 [Agrilus zanthoxylumi]
MTILMTFSFMISISFFFTKHPLSMGFNLLIQTILIALITGMLNLNFWYSFILFLIMIGGMLVLFIYMTSIASNEKFNFSMMMMITMISVMLIISITYYNMEPNISNIEFSNYMTYKLINKESWMNSLTKFFMYPINLKLMMMISYLFLALVAIVKITLIKYGPLRTKT